ncbi:hypothetical protein R1sor_003693 [Riccia sorocarpa]|uniref:Uncharacterized protein n=1 Tax=Riccia sorocarpa TaxID=122646 RepID=A0ABD3H415_9MARC
MSEDYFAKECRLPNDGVMPNDIVKALVSDEEVERCFGPRSGTKGRNGPKLNNCVGLPQSEVLHLFQVIDGHEKPVNNTLGVTFPRALYVERFLKKRINWARYAHERHRNQLRSSKARKESKPIGPPIIRPLRVYKPPADLVLEPLDSEDALASPKREVRSPKHEPNLKTEAAETSMLAKEKPGASVIMGGSLGEAPESSSVIPEVRPVKLASPASYMPGFIELKDDIAVREKLIAKLRADITALTEAIVGFRGDLLLANESIAKTESRYKAENANREKLESERATLAEAKLSLKIRLDDGGFDEENPEDMKLLHSLESEEEELNLKHSGVLSALEECTVRLKQSQSELKLSRDLVEESKVQVENGEREIETAEKAIAREQSKLDAQIQELNCLRPFVESPLAALSPRYIPTATEVTKTIFRLLERNVLGGFPLQPQKSEVLVPAVQLLAPEKRREKMMLVLWELIMYHVRDPGQGNELARKERSFGRRLKVSLRLNLLCRLTGIIWSTSGLISVHFLAVLNFRWQEFFEKYGHDVLSLRKFVSSYLASTAWAITVIGTPSADGYLRVLSFSRAGIRSPNIVSKMGSASAHLGVVVVPMAHDQAFLAMEITSSYGRSSLEALLRVQTRVDNLSREIAEAIAAIKLEQEEEFADSASEWA